MGEVWRAREIASNTRVALKFLREDMATDAQAKKRFVREARLATQVRHPNVVALLDVVDTPVQPFLVMELLNGETLGARLRRKGRLECNEVAALALPMFDAIEAAHATGIVHRDLKPENIFIARDGAGVRVRVLDFGIAKQIETLTEDSLGLTTAGLNTTGAMLGTPYYMAPEQALGERDVDARADLWSIGIILYECLSGKRPTEAATVGAVLKILVTDAIVPLATHMPALDVHLADEIMDLLRSDRDQRATSLTALRTTLQSLYVGDGGLDLPDDEEPALSAAPILTNNALQRSRSGAKIAIAIAIALSAAAAYAWRTEKKHEPIGAVPARAVSSNEALITITSSATSSDTAMLAPHTERAPSSAASTTTMHTVQARGHYGAASPVSSSALPAHSSQLPTSATSRASLGRGPGGLVTNSPFPVP
jgi:eukaryotic-like serine/threonine-protein kinase